ncbi:alpha/beta hydrolase fold [candidate division TM7 genomosp. GTL1]|nr:alpha/beta hydrolase fold [candidate division TM7 genomosp. GTL1]
MAQVTSKDGATIGYTSNGIGPLVVMVNGAVGYREYYGGKELATRLAENFTTIIYDRRGRGESTDRLPYAVEREIEDIEALIDANGGKAYLYGESSGAALALKAAAQLGGKVAKVAMYEPPYGLGDEAKEGHLKATQQLKEFLAADKRDEAVGVFMTNFMPREAVAEFKKTNAKDWEVMVAVAPTLVYDYILMDDAQPQVDEVKALDIPVLVMNGSQGIPGLTEACEVLAKASPNNVRHKVLEGQAHEPTADVLAPELTAFFQA